VPKFRYVGDDVRVYPDFSVVVEPGDELDLDDAPADGRWTPCKPAKPAASDTATEA
jgi:hypothetical protein